MMEPDPYRDIVRTPGIRGGNARVEARTADGDMARRRKRAPFYTSGLKFKPRQLVNVLH
jgi:hypothetical protein